MGNKSCCEQESDAPGANAAFAKPAAQAGSPADLSVPALADPPPLAPDVAPPSKSREVAAVAPDERTEEAAAPPSAQDMAAPAAPEVEPPTAAASTPQFPTFEATLKHEAGAPLSFLVERGFEALSVFVVGKFSGGPAAAWNATQESDATRLMLGDRIVKVNGAAGKREDLVIAAGATVTLTVERWPEEYAVQLKRETSDAKFGMKVELVERSNGVRVLRVGEIRKGVLEDWNEAAKAEGRLHEIVTPGTALLEVCGEKGNHDTMMSKLQGREVLLNMKRPEVGTIERLGGAQPPVAG